MSFLSGDGCKEKKREERKEEGKGNRLREIKGRGERDD